MTERKVAKVFQNGGSQAVRLPAEFRFDVDEVYVFRDEESGDVVLTSDQRPNAMKAFMAFRDAHPVSDDDWAVFDDAVAEVRRTSRPYDDSEIRRLFELDE